LRGVGLLSLRSRGEAQLLSSSVPQGNAQLTPHTLLLLLVLLSVCCSKRVLLLLLPALHWQSPTAGPCSLLPLHAAAQHLAAPGPTAAASSPALLQQLLRMRPDSQGCDSSSCTVARCLGSLTSMRATQLLATALMPAHAGWSKSGSESSTALMICLSVAPSNGRRPASMRKTTTPTDQMSASGP
jgi:hypothetical protein